MLLKLRLEIKIAKTKIIITKNESQLKTKFKKTNKMTKKQTITTINDLQ